jgi:hypothetical protein
MPKTTRAFSMRTEANDATHRDRFNADFSTFIED